MEFMFGAKKINKQDGLGVRSWKPFGEINSSFLSIFCGFVVDLLSTFCRKQGGAASGGALRALPRPEALFSTNIRQIFDKKSTKIRQTLYIKSTKNRN